MIQNPLWTEVSWQNTAEQKKYSLELVKKLFDDTELCNGECYDWPYLFNLLGKAIMRFAYDAKDQSKLVSQVAAIPCSFYVDRQNSLFNLAVNVETD